MNSSERVRKAIRFQGPDRSPISHAVLPAAQLKYGKELLGVLGEYRDDFGWDYMSDLAVEDYPALYKRGRNVDSFGTVWYSEVLGVCGIPIEWPIKEIEEAEAYRWPADFSAGPPKGRQYSGHMLGLDGRWYARGGWITFFEQLQQLRGMENFLVDLALAPAALERLMDRMLEFDLAWVDRWTKLGYEGIHFADDWGGQESLLIDPAAWRRLFKPRYRELFKRVKDAGMDVWFHSDGRINEIMGDLVEIGVDVLNCQIAVIGHDWLTRNFRGKVAFRTDIDRQWVMPFGTPAMVREEVQRTLEACGTPSGGVIACGEIGPDVPLENIRAMYGAFREFDPVLGRE
jgi:uroporphyrinogen decarboxylase